MRIRRSAARLLGSAYTAAPAAPGPDAAAPPQLLLLLPPPPLPQLAPCSAPPESLATVGFAGPETASGEPCELSRSPWDLIAELSLSDPQVEDDLVDKYFVNVTTRASWLFSPSMPAASAKKVKKKPAADAAGKDSARPQNGVAKKVPKKVAASKVKHKEGEAAKKAKVKKEEGEEGAPQVWRCKKNDGKTWHCHRTVSEPNSLCKYHCEQRKRSNNPEFDPTMEEETAPLSSAASKPSLSSKPRKKKPSSDFNATEGFYYYAGFGPFRSKRHCRSTTHDSVPVKQEAEEEEPSEDASPPPNTQVQADADGANQAAARDDVSSCDDDIAGIAGFDEDSSDDDFDGVGTCGRSMNGNGDANGDGKRKTPWKKRWRKPVKARSLKSLM